MMTKVERRLRLAYCSHAVVPSLTLGYFLCHCGCGYIGVCRHCVPHAPAHIPWRLCETAQVLVQAGQAVCEDGYVYVRTV